MEVIACIILPRYFYYVNKKVFGVTTKNSEKQYSIVRKNMSKVELMMMTRMQCHPIKTCDSNV